MQSALSKLAGYRKPTTSFKPINEVKEETILTTEEVTNEENKEQEQGQEVLENENQEIQSDENKNDDNENEVIVDENKNSESDETDTQDQSNEESESENEKEDEGDEDEDIEINEDELTEEEKKLYDSLAEIYKKSGKKNVDQLLEDKGFNKVMSAVEEQLGKLVDEKLSIVKEKQELEDEIMRLKKEQIEQKKVWELEKLEVSRYQLDENDEYILDLKKRLSNNKEDQIIKNKLRDEYLRAIAEVDPEFDMFEYRKRIEQKKTNGIENLSGAPRSSITKVSEDAKKPIGFRKRG